VAAKAIDRDLRDERRERQLRAGALVIVLLRLANLIDARVIDLEHRVDVREVRLLSTMCSAIFLRITDIRDDLIAAPRTNGAGAVRRPDARHRTPPSMKPRMSCLVTRPPMPTLDAADVDVVFLRDATN
jgi:hypothetical protein